MNFPNYMILSRRRFSRWLEVSNFSFNRIREDAEYFLERLETIAQEDQSPLVASSEDSISHLIKYDGLAEKFYLDYKYLDANNKTALLPVFQVRLLVKSAEVMNMLNDVLDNRGRLKKGVKFSREGFNALLRDFIAKENLLHLPKTYKRLQEKRKAYNQHGYVALINGRFGNDNASKGKSKNNT